MIKSFRDKDTQAIANRKRDVPPVHPGEVLLEEFMKPVGLNTHQLAMALRVPPNRISQIIGGERAVSADSALRLARYFGTTPDFWLGLQMKFDLDKARDELIAEIERDVHPRAA